MNWKKFLRPTSQKVMFFVALTFLFIAILLLTIFVTKQTGCWQALAINAPPYCTIFSVSVPEPIFFPSLLVLVLIVFIIAYLTPCYLKRGWSK